MAVKAINFKVKGMQRDLSASAFNPNFAYENMNIRLTPNKENTLLSITNEKGTKDMGVKLDGVPIGLAIIQDSAIVFTHEEAPTEGSSPDHIYKITIEDANTLGCTAIYDGDLDFDISHPLETTTYYESESVQKVYWVDGINQLRFVNVANAVDNNFKFNFVEKIDPSISVSITREDMSLGSFPAGIIQYFITYYNRYGQESGIVYQSPLYYLSYYNRGTPADEACTCSFNIRISDFDTSWDYIRVYSLHRTSINATPAAYIVGDISIKDATGEVHIYDLGNNEAIGDTDLLYKTRSRFTAKTLTQKYNTLFVGNIETYSFNIDSLFDDYGFSNGIRTCFTVQEYQEPEDYYAPEGVYPYSSLLSESYYNNVHFKGGELYRLGVQFQNEYGEWSNPVFVGDYMIKSYPYIQDNKRYVPKIHIYLNDDIKTLLKDSGIQAFRGLLAQPINNHKSIICQGVVAPTVYNINDRVNGNIWGVSSWFFRPFPKNTSGSYNEEELIIQWEHDKPLKGARVPSGEIQCAKGDEHATYNSEDITQYSVVNVQYWSQFNVYQADIYRGGKSNPRTKRIRRGTYKDAMNDLVNYVGEIARKIISERSWRAGGDFEIYESSVSGMKNEMALANKSNYFVDQNMLTLHSPDINDNNISLIESGQWKVRVVGVIPITSNYTSYDIQSDGTLFNISNLGKLTYDFSHSNMSTEAYGLSSAGLWNDAPVSEKGKSVNFVVYPWHRSGSLGDQSSVELKDNATRYSMLSTKVIANLRYSYNSVYFNSYLTENGQVSTLPYGDLRKDLSDTPLEVKVFNSNETTVSVLKDSNLSYYYYGNLDSLVNTQINSDNEGYPIYYTTEDSPVAQVFDYDKNVSRVEPISLKYKSSIHGVFKLGDTDNGKHIILPSLTISSNTSYNSRNTVRGIGSPYGIPLYDNADYEYLVEGIIETGNTFDYTFKPTDAGKYYFLHRYNGTTVPADLYQLVRVGSNGKPITVEVYNNSTFLKSDFAHYYTVGIVTSLNISNVKEHILESPYSKEVINLTTASTIASRIGDNSGIMYIVELYYNNSQEELSEILYGGTSKENLDSLQWLPNGGTYSINTDSPMATLHGDTYFSRWDCLKTYPFTTEDKNQVVEILSFMVESSVNLDGRTDRNRGQSNNNSVSPINFNLYNEVYNQKDNYFSYRIIEDRNSKLGSTIVWSARKGALEDIDKWTAIYLTNALDVDSRYGAVTRLTSLNNNLIFFQESSLGQLLYNENAQISTTVGVPVELGNTGTVTGYKYISDSIGLPDKWSFCNANGSLYFIDPHSSGIYQLSDSLKNLSDSLGYRTWINIHSGEMIGWNPKDFTGYVLYYDKANSELYIIGNTDCLVYSELLQQFVSFYSYEDTPYFFNLKNRGFFLRKDGSLWEQHEGDYNRFFGELKPYWIEVVANPESTKDKIFNNLEFRADVLVEGKADNTAPFDKLTVWNEYQEGTLNLSFNTYKISNLKKKFRIWRALIPRDDSNHRDRIRNPWAYVKLSKGESGNQDTKEAILHDMTVYYFD